MITSSAEKLLNKLKQLQFTYFLSYKIDSSVKMSWQLAVFPLSVNYVLLTVRTVTLVILMLTYPDS